MTKHSMFTFDPTAFSAQFDRDGYVHIPRGTSEKFLQKMTAQADENLKKGLMKEFAIGDKQQAMYEFPPDADYITELKRTVAVLCGFDVGRVVLSERHIKSYEETAAPHPHAHKDRFASEISFGISVHVRKGSTLILYPYDMTDVNPFNASTLLRASLSPDRYPEPMLRSGKAVMINDAPGDVIVFRGHSFWHLRENPAGTTMLYLKLNAFNCDPLGEDPGTPTIRKTSESALEKNDDQLLGMIPLIGRRVDYFHRMFNRNWEEVPGVVLWGEKHFTLEEQEMEILKSCDGKKTLRSVVTSSEGETDTGGKVASVRRLVTRGVLDLISDNA